MSLIVEFFRELILSLGPNIKSLLEKIIKQKQNEITDKDNVDQIKKDIAEDAGREKRENDTSDLINGK